MSLEKPEDLKYIKKLVEDGKLKPVIDKQFPLEMITDAHTYYENTHKKGSVIINIQAEK